MVYALSWLLVAALIALWSLSAWALHAVALLTVSNAGTLSGAASGAGAITLSDWLGPWVPPAIAQSVSQMLAGLGPFIDSLLQAAPALAGGVTVLSWGIWGLGCVALVVLGFGLHLLIALWRRQGGGHAAPVVRPSHVA